MSGFDAYEALFKPAFASVGMWETVQVLYAGTDVPFDLTAGYTAPDINPMTGVVSTDHEIEYEYRDATDLAEGDQVMVRGELYRLRESPRRSGTSGFFRKVLLTKVAPAC